MKVFVVMSSDFPDCVFATRELADQYVKDRTAEELELLKLPIHARRRGRIYWSAHEFEVRNA